MKKQFLTTVILLGSLPPLFGSSDPVAQQMLVAAKQQADIFHDQASPFQLEVDFVAQINIPTKGYLILKWESKDHWWRKVVMGAYGQIEVRNGEKLSIRRNVGFTPVQVRRLINLLAFPKRSEDLIAVKQRYQDQNGVIASCITAEKRDAKSSSHEVCIDAASQEILSDTWQDLPDEPNVEHFSDYFDFGGHRFPRKLQLRINSSTAIAANVTSLKTIAFDKALLVPPQGAIERRQCTDIKAPVLLNKVKIQYPKSALQNGLAGDSIASLTILADGTIEDVQLIGRVANTMDEAALEAMRKWKFKPAMCGTEPVVSDIEAVVSFRFVTRQVSSLGPGVPSLIRVAVSFKLQ